MKQEETQLAAASAPSAPAATAKAAAKPKKT
jgi:hypothetical protein